MYDSREDCNAIIDSKTNTLITGCMSTIIPNNTTSIGSDAFYHISKLTSINIPGSVTSIGATAFRGTRITSIEIPDNVTSIGFGAFWDCERLTSVKLPNNLSAIESYLFDFCTNLTSIVIPNSVTSIGEKSFAYCRNLNSIEIPEKVTSIGHSAFYECNNLTSVIIPESMKNIATFAFCLCTNLRQITCHATEPPVCEKQAFEQVPRLNCKLIVPEESVEAYMAANEWRGFYTADGIEGLEDESIVDVYNLQGVTVKKQVRMKDLQDTLPKGIYIINGKKIAVR